MGRIITIWGVVLWALVGCGAQDVLLSPAPNLYLDGKNYPTEQVPLPLQSVDPQIFYVTDRQPLMRDGATVGYDTGRSNSMAFGAAQVRYGATDWADLVARTHKDRGRRISRLEVQQVRELVRFSDTPLPTQRSDGALRFLAEAQARYDDQARAFQDAVRAEIWRTGNRRILVFAHGVNNSFENSLTALASLWHFAGRGSIPVAFTWPAGNRGPLAYFRDREAGDFSVYHAKEFLRLLADIPEVEDIDIVAHSRGTDVMAKALRELVIFNRGRGVPPKLAMKTGTLILAAADLDTGVVRQRLQAERVAEAFEQVNIYINPNDSALRLSSYLTKVPRIGAATGDDLQPEELARLQKAELIHIIRVEDAKGRGHSYFRENPAVLSDIVLALRTRAFPGGTLRPLERDETNFWMLHPNYPLDRLPILEFDAVR